MSYQPAGLTYVRDAGSWHVHLVRPDPATPDGLAEATICGLHRYGERWAETGVALLVDWDTCKLCARVVNARHLDLPALPLFVLLEDAPRRP